MVSLSVKNHNHFFQFLEVSPCSHKPCMHSGQCIEKGTLYSCICKGGYRGKDCRERDLCIPNPCTHGICTTRNNNAVCRCEDGWMGELCDSMIVILCEFLFILETQLMSHLYPFINFNINQ